jgi:poly(3-hydroxybutyrate) depolymerase
VGPHQLPLKQPLALVSILQSLAAAEIANMRHRLAKGSFVGLGRRLDLRDITCPVYLLAGESDDITTSEQVFNAEKYLGTPKEQIEKKLVPGGHIGLFMGTRTLQQTWPAIAHWIRRFT